MIITKNKHNKIVGMKDLEIKVLEGKLEGIKEIVKQRDLEIYEANKEANQLSYELDQVKEHLKDTDIALDLVLEGFEELEHENDELGDKILKLKEDYEEAQKEISEYKQRLAKIDDLKEQYKWYIDKTIKANVVTHEMTTKDVKKFLSEEGIEGITKLYMLFSMM